jgi:hypothetical protein
MLLTLHQFDMYTYASYRWYHHPMKTETAEANPNIKLASILDEQDAYFPNASYGSGKFPA